MAGGGLGGRDREHPIGGGRGGRKWQEPRSLLGEQVADRAVLEDRMWPGQGDFSAVYTRGNFGDSLASPGWSHCTRYLHTINEIVPVADRVPLKPAFAAERRIG